MRQDGPVGKSAAGHYPAEAPASAEAIPQFQCWQPYAHHEAVTQLPTGTTVGRSATSRCTRATRHSAAWSAAMASQSTAGSDHIVAMEVAAADDIAEQRCMPFYEREEDGRLLRQFARGTAGKAVRVREF